MSIMHPFPFKIVSLIIEGQSNVVNLRVSFYDCVWYTFHYESVSILKEFVYLSLCWSKLGGI